MLIITGGSGMLFEASHTLVKEHTHPVLLCGRQEAHYQPILKTYGHAHFFQFDFSMEVDYERLEEYLKYQQGPLDFLVWIHSPYYKYLANLLEALHSKVQHVYLVKGSNSHTFPNAWFTLQNMTVIQLDKHPTEERWLTHQEICQQVLKAMHSRLSLYNR